MHSSEKNKPKKRPSLPTHFLLPFILADWPMRSMLCGQESSAVRSKYWLRICAEIWSKTKSCPSPFFLHIPSAVLWLVPQTGAIEWAQHVAQQPHLMFFPTALGTRCNQAHRGEREHVWSCKPAISSAADDQAWGEHDPRAVQRGQRSTPTGFCDRWHCLFPGLITA